MANYQSLEGKDEHGLRQYLSDDLRKVVDSIPDEVWGLKEKELQALAQPVPGEYSLRASFWRELERAQSTGTQLKSRAVFTGICTLYYWKNLILKDQFKVAWLCKPVQNYEREIDALLVRGTERLWEIIDIPMEDPRNGRVCPRRATVLLEAIKMIENRAKGLAVQRSQTLNVNVKANSALPESPKELDNRIKELESKLNPILPPMVESTVTIDLPSGAVTLPVLDVPE